MDPDPEVDPEPEVDDPEVDDDPGPLRNPLGSAICGIMLSKWGKDILLQRLKIKELNIKY